jgi:Fic family protein
MLKNPMFYLSEYLESNRDTYYAKLNDISTEGKWNEWIDFYLTAVNEQGRRNVKRVENILNLYEDVRIKIQFDITNARIYGFCVR